MRSIFISIVLLVLAGRLPAQQPIESVWSFGRTSVLDFSTMNPVVGSLPNNGGAPLFAFYKWSATVCDNSGNILFWAKMFNSANATFNVFDRTGQSMPNGNLLTTNIGEFVPVVVPMPRSSTKYFLFYIQAHGLMYSVIDMSLNNGLGDVVSTQKNILLGKYGEVLDRKMVAVPGCNGAWIMVRSASKNEYLSYGITSNGIAATPTISKVGNFPLEYYGAPNSPSGVLKASPDGKRLAAACGNGNIYVPSSINGGLELYDVESCSGGLTNATVIDTGMFYGACFSPDGTKLYATKCYEQKVFQYDLSLPSIAAVRASRTTILANPNYGNAYPDEYILGELKRGIDGKIYLANHVCNGLPFTSAMHVINSPNLAGLASNPAINAIPLRAVCPGLDLPADIIYGGTQDTVYGRKDVAICFKDSGYVQAAPGRCYRWPGDTSTSRMRLVRKPGTYIVHYSDGNCRLHIDTMNVSFTRPQFISSGSFSCPNRQTGTAQVIARTADNSRFSFSWMSASGAIVRTQGEKTSDTLTGADTGTYRVRVTSGEGCDTVLFVRINALPLPYASMTGDSAVCKNAPVRFTNTSTAPAWQWYFDGKAASSDSSVVRTYTSAGWYKLMLEARNIEGCTDTASKELLVRELNLELEASKESVNIGEVVTLRSGSPQGYTVLAWQPVVDFPGAADYTQQINVIRTSTYTVIGESEYGCIDSATVTVHVNPVLFMPNAFTPNGDGLNDRFKPQSAGDKIFIQHFEIFNRWGQLVWLGFGRNAVEGWDGTFNGRPAELGTYYYTITVEAPAGGTICQKGDVILIR